MCCFALYAKFVLLAVLVESRFSRDNRRKSYGPYANEPPFDEHIQMKNFLVLMEK